MPHETAGTEVVSLMLLLKSLIVVMGGVVTWYAFKAYRRTRSRSLGTLATGFALITFGAVAGGLAHELLRTSLAFGIVLEGVFILLGLSLVGYSITNQ